MQVYLLQWDIIWNNKKANFEKVLELISKAKPVKKSLILLPEMFATGFMHAPRQDVVENFLDKKSKTVAFLNALAKETSCAIIGGGIAKEEQHLKNHVGFFIPEQETETNSYDKIHPFFSEKKCFKPGKEIVIFNWNKLNISPFICFDLRFPELFRQGIAKGAEAFYVGASWPTIRKEHWETLLKARAIENQAYVFGVNRIGKDPYASYFGGSCIISPKGEVLAKAENSESVISAEVDVEIVKKWREEFPVLKEI